MDEQSRAKSQRPRQAPRVTQERREQVIDEIVERAFPWGLFIGLGTLIGAAFPRETRAAAKTAMRTGFRAADWMRGVGAEAYEKGQDVFVEARLEYEQLVREAQREAERDRFHVVPSASSRTRATRARSNGHSSSRPRRRRPPKAGTTSTETG